MISRETTTLNIYGFDVLLYQLFMLVLVIVIRSDTLGFVSPSRTRPTVRKGAPHRTFSKHSTSLGIEELTLDS
jgi:hypothetical protein